ncbi:MAG: VOC family protein, partial [Chloroflexota bacterium]|nr:VOC family protein [Chloroflexota bacterium]
MSSSPFAAVNHVGFVVRDLEEGLRFFTEVLGFERIQGRAGSLQPDGDVQTRRFGIPADASGNYAFVRLGDAVIELLEWSAPDRNVTPPLNSDLGGRHLAITVADMDAAIGKLSGVSGVVVREPNAMGYVYCQTP